MDTLQAREQPQLPLEVAQSQQHQLPHAAKGPGQETIRT